MDGVAALLNARLGADLTDRTESMGGGGMDDRCDNAVALKHAPVG